MADNLLTRDEARALGLKRYFTGEPCKRGHVAERYVVNKDCVACGPAKKQRVSREKRDQHNAARRAKYAQDPKLRERRSALNKQYHEAHGEELKTKLRLRRATDPEWREEQNAKRRGRPQRHVHLKHFYGMTEEQYAAMFASQGGCCAICQQPSLRTLHVDHCHRTGKIRALLCTHCNNALGAMHDDPARLRAAADYLEKHLAVE